MRLHNSQERLNVSRLNNLQLQSDRYPQDGQGHMHLSLSHWRLLSAIEAGASIDGGIIPRRSRPGGSGSSSCVYRDYNTDCRKNLIFQTMVLSIADYPYPPYDPTDKSG